MCVKFRDKILSIILALSIFLSMIPISAFKAFNEEGTNSYVVEITIKDSEGSLIDEANVSYNIMVNDSLINENYTDIKSVNGKVIVSQICDGNISDNDNVVIFGNVSKFGYDDTSFEYDLFSGSGFVEISLNEKKKVKGQIKLLDSNDEKAISGVSVSIKGYEDIYGETDEEGLFSAEFYSGENYKIVDASCAGYLKYSEEEEREIKEDEIIIIYLTAKKEDDTLKFEKDGPIEITIGESFINAASSENQTLEQVNYSVDGDCVSVTDEGTVTALKSGEAKIIATIEESEEYSKATAYYTVIVKKAKVENFYFEESNINLQYSENLTFKNTCIYDEDIGKVTYSIIKGSDVAEIDEETGELKILKAGQVTVKATLEENDQYEEATCEYSLTIEQAAQTGFVFADPNPDSKNIDEGTFENAAAGGLGEGEITYEIISGSDYAEIKSPNEPTIYFKKGGGSVTVKATKAADERYKEVSTTYTLDINLIEQEEFYFSEENPKDVYYNDNDNQYMLETKGGSGNGAVTYSIIEGDAAELDNSTLIIKKSGIIKIRAVKEADDVYKKAFAEIRINVKKSHQKIEFDFPQPIDIIYGNQFVNQAKPVENSSAGDGRGYALSQNINYSVVKGEEIASVDNDGKLIFNNNKVGLITVKAEIEGDDCYEPASATYSLNVKFLDKPASPYEILGEKKNNSEWYSTDVVITPPEGYTISFSNNLIENKWLDELVITDEGRNEKTVYLKSDKGITDAIEIDGKSTSIDKTSPRNLKVSYDISVSDKILHYISFGFYKAPVNVTIEAVDDVSGIEYFEYSYTSELTDEQYDGVVDSDNITYDNEKRNAKASFKIESQFRGNVSFKAVDAAGNDSVFHDEKVIIVDDIAPGISVTYDNNNSLNDMYYDNIRTAKIIIDEDNYFEDDVKDGYLVITIGKRRGEEEHYTNTVVTPRFTKNGSTYEAYVVFDEDAEYTFDIKYTDRSGNVFDSYKKDEFVIDKTAPKISIAYDNNESVNENYYSSNRTAVIKIVEQNFNPENVLLEELNIKDVNGNNLEPNRNYQDILKNGEWNHNGDVHTIELPFDMNGSFDFAISYIDLAGNEGETKIADSFIINKEAPKNLSIEYSTSILDTILENITFGFYQSPVTVTISADDNISKINYFTYSYGTQVGQDLLNTGKKGTVINSDDIIYSGKMATATFEIPAQFKGNISFSATNMANIESDVFNDSKVIVVDDIAPEISVTYDNNNSVNNTYFNADRTAIIAIKESNFFIQAFDKIIEISDGDESLIDEYLVITVVKETSDGVKTTKTLKNSELTVPFKKADGDIWIAKLLFEDDADYEFKISYKDFSGNVAKEYTEKFTIDKTKPIASITYYGEKESVDGDEYKSDVKAILTVIEENFSVSDVSLDYFSAKDIQGNDVDLTSNYEELLHDGAWEHNGDTHTLEIPFEVDAIYNLNISFTDLSGNEAVTNINNRFSVDKCAPSKESLKISYSTSVLDLILKGITFGFYDAPVTVTLEADDSISGVDSFIYSYTSINGSDNDEDGENILITSDSIDYFNNGKNAKATFKIPPQFTGNISFCAIDRSGNCSEVYDDDKVIVVDNVAPVVSVEYDNNEVYNDNYYTSSRMATITINEENFFVEAFDEIEDEYLLEKVDAHLKINVVKELNDGSRITKTYKNEDLTLPFEKISDDNWQAKLLFEEDADYFFEIEYKDYSGNVEKAYNDSFTIDTINPKVSVFYNNNYVKNDKYFNDNRDITISIEEHNFNSEDVEVIVTSKNATSEVMDYNAYFKDINNWVADGNVYTASASFSAEANYTFDISYTDKSGRVNDNVDYKKSVAPKEFTIDKTAPTNADIKIGERSIISDKSITFETFYNEAIAVKFDINCDISGLDNVMYQKVSSVSDYSYNGSWTNYKNSGVKIQPTEKFIIYFKVTDKAGNVAVVNSLGIVVDDKAPVGEKNAPEIGIDTGAANKNGYYNSDVFVSVKVVDPQFVGNDENDSGFYSGLSKITYRIKADDINVIENGVLFDALSNKTEGSIIDADKLASTWSGRVKIDANKFNSNNVVFEVTAVDNAGNIRTTTNQMLNKPIKIDVTKPKINISYDNNSANNSTYFKMNRTATIVITERNFNPDDIKLNISNTNGVLPTISSWTRVSGKGNNDDTRWVASISYNTDGDYNFDIEYTDLAGNKCDKETYDDDTVAPKAFTIDKTTPVISVTYDNNSNKNNNYYKANRTATIAITEHNFDANLVDIIITANDRGKNISLPTISRWITNGDRHTATIRYEKDAFYTFDISVRDKAANQSKDFVNQSFYIDKTAPELVISGVINGSANSGDLAPIISYSDANYDSSNVRIMLNSTNKNEIPLDGVYSKTNNGGKFTFNNFANEKSFDDIYTLTAELTDKAGNTTQQKIVFSVNRFGSTYLFNEGTKNLNNSYLQNGQDVIITEINVDKLKNFKVTLFKNNETFVLKEGEDYKIDIKGGNGQWYEYKYTVFDKNFDDDGVYRLVFHSEDEAGNVSNNTQDTKDKEISFGVDRIKPNIVITNLEAGKTYSLDKKTVLMTVSDNLLIKSIKVYLDDYENEYASWTENEIKSIIENGQDFTFDILGDSTSKHKVKIISVDAAGNDEVVEIVDFFVTTNLWIRFYNNSLLFFGAIGGAVLTIGLITFFVAVKKRKRISQ